MKYFHVNIINRLLSQKPGLGSSNMSTLITCFKKANDAIAERYLNK
jgi:hypothetical protein